ncbi:TBC1 domain family member 20 [Bacillus rossius redtenbacheri]|uniref:TBC1 domain family member 20 n=1 Tax=Bacillus rossius redtenbacheri TaxID=93214 RepID=UPI002FDC88B2
MSLRTGLGSGINNGHSEENCTHPDEHASETKSVCDSLCAKEANGNIASEELKFEEAPLSPAYLQKIRDIEEVLLREPLDVETLKEFARSDGGLINDGVRRRAWPLLLGLDASAPTRFPSQEELEAHPEYQQVVLDVNRSLKRFPPGIPYEQRVALQEQLTRLILRVISKYPHLRYYQGYHDVAVTFLLVVGETAAFQIMERLSVEHLRDCMEPTMEKTSHLLNYVYPLVRRLHPALYDYLERSGVGTMFCLPWFLTWYGHSLNRYRDVVRLYDFFLVSPPLMPLYLAAVLVAHRADQVFSVECDMASVHSLLSQIPDDLPFERLLVRTERLYQEFPPESIEREVRDRVLREQQHARRGEAQRRPAPARQGLATAAWAALPRLLPQRLHYRYVLVTATLVGIYAYLRMADALGAVR